MLSRRRWIAVATLSLALLPLSGCKEATVEESAGYEPSKLEALPGDKERKRVTFTAEGASRTGLETEEIRDRVIPYAALLYDPEGKTYVYTSPEPLSYVREEIKVDRIDGDRVHAADAPANGTKVVTVGAVEVYGAELEIAEK